MTARWEPGTEGRRLWRYVERQGYQAYAGAVDRVRGGGYRALLLHRGSIVVESPEDFGTAENAKIAVEDIYAITIQTQNKMLQLLAKHIGSPGWRRL